MATDNYVDQFSTVWKYNSYWEKETSFTRRLVYHRTFYIGGNIWHYYTNGKKQGYVLTYFLIEGNCIIFHTSEYFIRMLQFKISFQASISFQIIEQKDFYGDHENFCIGISWRCFTI